MRQWVGSAFVLDESKPVFGSHVTTCWNRHTKKPTHVVVGITGSDLLGILRVDTDDKFINNYTIAVMPKLHLDHSTKWVFLAFLHNYAQHHDKKVLTVNRLLF